MSINTAAEAIAEADRMAADLMREGYPEDTAYEMVHGSRFAQEFMGRYMEPMSRYVPEGPAREFLGHLNDHRFTKRQGTLNLGA